MKGITSVLAWLIALFVICTAGQIIKDKSCSIQENLFDTQWYKADIGIQKDILFIMMRAQQLDYVQIFPTEAVNYNLFIKIIQASYSYLAVMRNITSK